MWAAVALHVPMSGCLLQSRLREVDNASLRLDEARRKHYKGAQKELKVLLIAHPADR